MKIKTVQTDWNHITQLPIPTHQSPKKPSLFFRTLMRVASASELKAVRFSYTDTRPDSIKKQPCLILMNHSSFTDLSIVSKVMYPQPYGIVITADGLIGKPGLMRNLGCIPTQKFVSDFTLVRDISDAIHKKKMSVLMYPEASYTFDGTETALPKSLGGLVKLLKVPVVMIRTYGAFARDPLYNCLQKRDVTVTAAVSQLFGVDEIGTMTKEDINQRLKEAFTYDHFAWQRDNRVRIAEPFRADGLERILYTCPSCKTEGKTEGKGTKLTCHACGKSWTMDEYGQLSADNGETEFAHVPDWYEWEREFVRNQIKDGTYRLDVPVRIGVVQDYKAVYLIGNGRLTHSTEGFCLVGDNGQPNCTCKPLASYSLYADYFWYELGDVIIIGDNIRRFCCFPPKGTPVAKARLATEELYRNLMQERRSTREPNTK